jgi:hypothetical protein
VADDDTAAFDCGRDALNHWFRRHAWRNQELGVSRTSVICEAETGGLIGYVSLKFHRRRPRSPLSIKHLRWISGLVF